MQSLQDTRKASARCHPPAAGYPDLEARGVIEVPVVLERSHGATGAHDQVDRGARDNALQVGSSG